MPKQPAHKWQFTARFRPGAYGWRGTALAKKRIQEALKEIQQVDSPELAAEGATRLLERLVPAIENIDGSSGAMGAAVRAALHELVDAVTRAAGGPQHADRVERIYQAYQEEGMGYYDELGELWGTLCASPELASAWADRLVPPTREAFSSEKYAFFQGSTAALSSLVAAGRYQETLDLLALSRPSPPLWFWRKFGVKALQAMGRPEEALAMAQNACKNDFPLEVGLACEEMLLSLGREEEAYRQYGLTLERSNNYKSTFKAICKRYPQRRPSDILQDLVERSPDRLGQWFTAAMDLKNFPLAMDCARQGRVNPATLQRAVPKLPPEEAAELALMAVRGYVLGHGFEVDFLDFQDAVIQAQERARAVGREPETLALLRQWSEQKGGSWLRDILNRQLALNS